MTEIAFLVELTPVSRH